MHGASSPGRSATTSPGLQWANELPDDPVQASHAVHLYPASLAPPFSPGHPMGRTNSESSHYFSTQPRSPMASGLGLQPGLNPPQTPSRLIPPSRSQSHVRASPEPSIFERDIEPAHHARSPQEAIDVSVPPVLDDAASAILDDSGTLEIIQPEHPPHTSSPQRSPSVRLRNPHLSPPIGTWTPTRPAQGRPRNLSGGQSLRENSSELRHIQQQQQFGRQRGHRRPLSDASNVFTSLPMHAPRADADRSSLRPPTPLTPRSRSFSAQRTASPSVSLDGAIISGNDAATMGHSLDGLADTFAHLVSSPSEQPPQVATPGSVSSVQGSYFALNPDESTSRASRDRSSVYASPNAFRYRVLEREAVPPSPPSHLVVSPGLGPARAATSPGPSTAPMPRSPVPRHTAPVPGAPAEHLQVPGERKRLSFMAYADIVNDSHGQLLDLDESVHLQMQQEQGGRTTPESRSAL